MKVPKLVAKANRLLPDLDALEEQLENEPGEIISRAFPARDPGLRVRAAIIGNQNELTSTRFDRLDTALEQQRQEYVQTAKRAVRKIRTKGEDAELEPHEVVGLEAIVQIVGRPAILIQDDRFFPPPQGWEMLEQARASIESTCRSVGRIDVIGHPSLQWAGTGFLVAEDVVMTNRHVATDFCRWESGTRWVFEADVTANIDYVEELGAITPSEFALESIIGVHEKFDLALFKVSRTSAQGSPAPEPLTVASEFPDATEGRKVYVVGYPTWDGRRNDPDVMQRIFSNIYSVKRLQPGEIQRVFKEKSVLNHDCSTLGGNSGSCVIDLETNQVIGLHFGGQYLESNEAVALWTLTDDSLLKEAKIRFA